jgi:hypothetical protein
MSIECGLRTDIARLTNRLAHSQQQVDELTEKLAATKAQNKFDATRLRRLVTFCGVSCPDSDDELLQVAGVVIGSCLRVLPTMLAKERQVGRDEVLKELHEDTGITDPPEFV